MIGCRNQVVSRTGQGRAGFERHGRVGEGGREIGGNSRQGSKRLVVV